MFPALGTGAFFRFRDRADAREILVDLPVEFLSVCYDEKRPVSRHLPQYLLREEDHRVAFARALRVPEDSKAAAVLPNLADGFDRAVDTEVLVVLGEHLHGRT